MNVRQMRHVVRDLLNFIGTRMIIIDEVHALLASTCRRQRIGVLATSNRKLPFGHSGNRENCKSPILRSAESAAPAALVFNISIESIVSCLEGRHFRQENEGLMRKTGISVCWVESSSPVF
jgi:hypothetical protein